MSNCTARAAMSLPAARSPIRIRNQPVARKLRQIEIEGVHRSRQLRDGRQAAPPSRARVRYSWQPTFLGAAAFDGVALGAPAQHASRKIGDIAEAGLLQDDGGLRRTAAGAADGDNRTIARQLPSARGQFPERDQDRATDVSERPGELLQFADIEDLSGAQPGCAVMPTSLSGRPHLRLAGTATSIFFGCARPRLFM